MKPQSPQRNTLSTPNEYSFKEITQKIISYALEIHSLLGPGLLENLYVEAIKGIHIAPLLTYLRTENIVINFNVERLKDGIKRVVL